MMTALLAVVLMLAACGPALTEEEAAQLTREASGAVTGEGETEAVVEGGETTGEVAAAPTLDPALGEPMETDSGLLVYETVPGTGRQVQPDDIVTMHILGTVDDGSTIADTYSDGQPIVANANEDDLFAGWLEGLLLMSEGGKSRLIIPPALAFGEEGIPGVIPANATITLDVEVLSTEAPPQPTALDEADFTTTDSGLKYYDITPGTGETPVDGQDVVVDYAAWVQDGPIYIASSTAQGEPLTFTLGSEQGVFPGWDEGVSTMQVGGKRQLIIPAELALGEAGGGRIPPNATLIMEVELLEVKPLLLPAEIPAEDFTTTDSGLQYYDIVEGDGATPEEGQLVTVNYTGWLQDGLIKFDSSLDRGVPFTFPLGQGAVIDGWDEGLSTMKVGGTRQLIIPAELAYGDTGSGGLIPPGATLIFEVELLSAEDQTAP
jgi:peptidylprolyl isomerase